MDKKKLKKLADKIQLEIKKKEIPAYLENFSRLEKLLIGIKKTKIGKGKITNKRMNNNYFDLKDLEKLEKKFQRNKTNKNIIKNNSDLAPNGFILFKHKKNGLKKENREKVEYNKKKKV
ncbi:hypothetical protein [endosymbiont GvMRE of Glomus versiforme]|uniref:hypothetical protein n=1 Tax=endosymbiont GvMRE of Glomus versiforme TaxID=2039283 RepID=UPI000EC0D993|nr:hypothetical protein [endosymbiont GvMRE of Glomus versiforme]RHZ35343.1 hypothetical protein GvMRE_IIg549 [endosymbiont GvMRE of Glomus versiforme]